MILDAHHPHPHQEAQEQEQEQESGGMRDQTPSMSLLTYSKKWYPPLPPSSLSPLTNVKQLRPQVERLFPLWTYLGLTSGAIIGFITGNLPGAAIGAYAGSKLGKVRDAKGKAVYQVFKDLGGEQKAEILKALASKVFTMAAGNVS